MTAPLLLGVLAVVALLQFIGHGVMFVRHFAFPVPIAFDTLIALGLILVAAVAT